MTNELGFSPRGGRILVRLHKVEEKSKGGIILHTEKDSRSYKKATQDATVIEVSPHAWMEYPEKEWCKVGDIVKIAKYSGEDFELESGDTYRLIEDRDIMMVRN